MDLEKLEKRRERFQKWDEISNFVKEQSENWVVILGWILLAVGCLAGIVLVLVVSAQLSVEGAMNIKESIAS